MVGSRTIQKYFEFLKVDGRVASMIFGYDAYEITSYIWCKQGEKPIFPQLEGLRYYWGRTILSGMELVEAKLKPHSSKEVLKYFHTKVQKTKDEMEELIKKELGDRDIWVYSTGPPYELKLLRRI